jgi:hypothetical protein
MSSLIGSLASCQVEKAKEVKKQSPFEIKESQEKSKDMQDILKEYINGSLKPESLEIKYRIGDEFTGITSFDLLGNGKYQLISNVRKGRLLKNIEGSIEQNHVRDLVSLMQSNELWNVSHFQAQIADGDRVTSIEVRNGEDSQTVVLWGAEVKEVPAYNKVQDRILELIKEISSGEILELGR